MKGSGQVSLLHIIETSQRKFNEAVNEVLENPKYSFLKSETNSYIEFIREKIRNTIKRFLEEKLSDTSINKGASLIVIIVLLIVFAVIIAWIITRIIRGFERKKPIKNILGEYIDENTTPLSLKEKAVKAVQMGNFREAIRYDYIALLFLLHEKGFIYLEETKTNEEIYNYLRMRNFYLLNDMRICINLFNAIWYGHKRGNQEMYERWTRSFLKLWNEVMNYEEKKR